MRTAPVLFLLLSAGAAHAAPTLTPGPNASVVGGELKLTLQEPAVGQPDKCDELGTYRGTLAEVSDITSAFDAGEVVGVDVVVGQIKSAGGGLYSRKVGACVGSEVSASQLVVSGFMCPAWPDPGYLFDLTIIH